MFWCGAICTIELVLKVIWVVNMISAILMVIMLPPTPLNDKYYIASWYSTHVPSESYHICNVTGPLMFERPHLASASFAGVDHYSDVILSAMAVQITGVPIVCSTVYYIKASRHWPCEDNHRWPVDSPHIRPETRKMFPFDDVIMWRTKRRWQWHIMCYCGKQNGYSWRCLAILRDLVGKVAWRHQISKGEKTAIMTEKSGWTLSMANFVVGIVPADGLVPWVAQLQAQWWTNSGRDRTITSKDYIHFKLNIVGLLWGDAVLSMVSCKGPG